MGNPLAPHPIDTAYVRYASGDPSGLATFLLEAERITATLIDRIQWGQGGRDRRADAEDAFQDILLDLYQQGLAGTLVPSRTTWRNLLYRLVRRRMWQNARHDRRIEFHASLEGGGASPHEAFALCDEYDHIVALAARKLDPRKRRILLARAMGWSYREISVIVGLTPASARVYHALACRELRRAARAA